MGRQKSKNVVQGSSDLVPVINSVNPIKFKKILSKRNKGMVESIKEQTANDRVSQKTLEVAIFTKVSGIFSEFNISGNLEHGCTFLTSRSLQPIFYSPDPSMAPQRLQFSKGLDHPNTSVALFWGLVPCFIVMKGHNKTQIWMYSREAFLRHRDSIWNVYGKCFSLSAFYDLPRNFENEQDWVVFNEAVLKNTFLATVFTHACFILHLLTNVDGIQHAPDLPVPANSTIIDVVVLEMIYTCCQTCLKLIADVGDNVFQGAAAVLQMQPKPFSTFVQDKLKELIQHSALRRDTLAASTLLSPTASTLPTTGELIPTAIPESFSNIDNALPNEAVNPFYKDQVQYSSTTSLSWVDGFGFDNIL